MDDGGETTGMAMREEDGGVKQAREMMTKEDGDGF